jgi:hypothetical protein
VFLKNSSHGCLFYQPAGPPASRSVTALLGKLNLKSLGGEVLGSAGIPVRKASPDKEKQVPQKKKDY